jgi:SAM-dependent methyltransferase
MVHWCRKVMNDATEALVSNLPIASMEALEISGADWQRKEWKQYRSVHYPAFDICYDTLPDAQFDIVIAEQVLEHVKYPYRAVRNMYRMIRPDGYCLLTTPFLVQIHMSGADYTRWSPEGIKYLLEECGFDPTAIAAGGWGNRQCIFADFNLWVASNRQSWTVYDAARHDLANETDFPMVVWALAKKT